MDGAIQNPTRPARDMERIAAIEGMRGWLAWIVVAGHVVQITGLDYTDPPWGVFNYGATHAVRFFIIISGFVIAGLIETRKEPWPAYITRRAFRIFPAYLIALAASAVTLHLVYRVLPDMTWVNAPAYRYADAIRTSLASVQNAPWAHALLDLSLFQGAAPEQILSRAPVAILGPAWSLSLEWQFYLIAPALIWLLAQKRWRLATVIASFALVALYRLGLFGHFVLPSFLPGSLHFFLIGIACRFALPLVRAIKLPAAAAIGLLALGILFHEAIALFGWAALYVFFTSAEHWTAGGERWLRAIARAAVESPLALALGARSYSVYIVHWPLLQLIAFLVLPLHPFTQIQAAAVLGPLTLIATLLASDLLYRHVERPMIRLGARIVSGRRAKASEKLDQALQAETP
jgi:peptidoglycan/LPS O-acetylase OafA/YrhL